jgi:E3 ubiquitin-protein ligase DOA10
VAAQRREVNQGLDQRIEIAAVAQILKSNGQGLWIVCSAIAWWIVCSAIAWWIVWIAIAWWIVWIVTGRRIV